MSDLSVVDAPFGVNVLAQFRASSGLGEAARSTIRTLEAAGIDFTLNDVQPTAAHDNGDGSSYAFSDENPYPINIVHLNPDAVLRLPPEFSLKYFRDRYNIGVWLWENLDFPSRWYPVFDYFDEIWTPSTLCLESISLVAPIPVVKVPLSIELRTPSITREQFGIPGGQFVFLFVFDFCSFFKRKNPQAIIEAFLRAFGASGEGPLLVIKSANAEVDPPTYEALKHAAKDSANILFIDQMMSRDEIEALIYNCHCFVSLHRSEGFGLTIAEAMYFNKPVIATGYSANMDFMRPSNSFPVNYELRPVADVKETNAYTSGGTWAEPSVPHAAQLMRAVFDDQERARMIGLEAGKDIRCELSPTAVAEIVKVRLERIREIMATRSEENPALLRKQVEMALTLSRALSDRIAEMTNGEKTDP